MIPLAELVNDAFYLYSLVLLARVLSSWIPGLDPRTPAVQLLVTLTEPVLAPLRRALPPVGGLDLSPVVAFVLLEVVRRLVVAFLAGL
ncbi:MAG: YggT family protein [Armatimonadota bacterium]|nr:YggT family protein [Armatimonadota bacterium]MDR5675301.1 YggT family protein [Armatimonadota bacterium]MDR5688919.1 YggT family protein [Armatimonadota bacterium]MDR7387526.1 YggT family protein [Armatimonadota bacterium]MDR7389456.1 YggT family protein [Armatimonadota bacterium]